MKEELLAPFAAEAHAAAKPVFPVREVSTRDAPPRGDAFGDAPEGLKRLAAANGFRGEAGVLLAGEEGVLLGVGGGEDPFTTAVAGDRLPEGDFALAGSLASERPSLAALGWLLGAYRFDRYRAAPAGAARLIAPEGLDVQAVRRAAAATGAVRDLVNTPAGDMLPHNLATAAETLAGRYGAEISVVAGEDLLEWNLPMIHAVGRASHSAPRLIDMRWGAPDAPKVTLVGKGVCFDSGGLNIKPGSGMALMKKDMGGAANVLGLAQMLMDANTDIALRVLVPAVENAIAGDAFRPGDVLKSRKGTTVEIGNTDAEGRLVLADALDLAAADAPALLISMATLTGAARVAVGPDLAPFYTDDQALAREIETAAEAEHDPVWRLPLWKPYAQMLSSSVADLNNISGGSFAGSITAALFLEHFIAPQTPWIHFDIYAWRPTAAPGRPVGGEAQAIRALYRLIRERFS